MIASLALAAALLVQTPPAAAQDGPVVTATPEGPVITAAPAAGETAEALRLREAVAYANPLPRGAPAQDYPLVAWCEALVNGHVALGQTLTDADPLDQEIIRLGRLEAADFRSALAAAAEAAAKWAPLAGQDEAVRSQAFGLFFGLPGRCEHAARRLRENITTPPATPEEVGLE